jgi:hypothetical protein
LGDPLLSHLRHPCRVLGQVLRECEAGCIVALLVDSDAPVIGGSPAKHLESKLNSAGITKTSRKNIFLMVQFMEAWLVTDAAALEKCFGRDIRAIKLPKHSSIEAVSKEDILAVLDLAAKKTPTRHYHKIRDGARILEQLDPEVVAKRSKHARELHDFLRQSAQA